MNLFWKDGFSVEYSSINYDLQSFRDDFNRMLDFMNRLEGGEPVNYSENRKVGHYWLRNPSLAPQRDIQNDILAEIDKVRALSQSLKSDYSTVLYAGIGGSGLGPSLIYDCFSHRAPGRSVIILDNVDPEGVARKTSNIRLESTLCSIVSKSGTTTETILLKDFLRNLYAKMSLEFAAVAITMEDSLLWREAENWIERFKIWDWVGGRTSIFSSVGLFVFGFMDLDIDQFLSGGKFMDDLTRNQNINDNPAAIISLTLIDAFKRGKRNVCIVPYSDRLELFSKYLQQLFMESLGKTREDGEHFGLTVYGNKGTTDQHSFFQQLRDGTDDFTLILIRRLEPEISVEDSCLPRSFDDYLDAFLLGSRKAVVSAGRTCLTLTVPKLNEFWFGALVALFERVVGYFASYFNINAYDQPGVEAGKKAAKEFLESGENLKKLL